MNLYPEFQERTASLSILLQVVNRYPVTSGEVRMSHHLYRSRVANKHERLNHAAKTVQRYKDGGLNAARRTINWFISADRHNNLLN